MIDDNGHVHTATGTCAHHDAGGASRKRINDRGRVHPMRVKRASVSTPPKAQKGQKQQNP